MRLATIRLDGANRAARVEGGELHVLPFADVGQVLRAGPDWRDLAAGAATSVVELSTADFAPLVPAPEKIICVGANYEDHVKEVGLSMAPYPSLFAKFARSLIGANDDIQLPCVSDSVDWEAELGVVIGTELRHVRPEEALAGVAGYTIVNDVSARDWQLRTSQFLQGKTFESTTPVGPYLVTPDELADEADLEIGCTVDGTQMQRARTSEMVFGVAHLVSYASQIVTLAPGDLIATGTPAGIGAVRTPPRYLVDGSVLETTIEGLGRQVNRCRAAQPAVRG